jgi:hypothetical protein
MRKILLILGCLLLSGCELYIQSDPIYSCGYEELPYLEEPISCSGYDAECCTWIVDEFYSECVETWCHDEYLCSWQLAQYTCYPI